MGRIADILNRRSAVTWLVGVNVAVFLVVAIDGILTRVTGNGVYEQYAILLSLPNSCESWLSVAPWSLVTYMFTHYDFIHLLVNMLWLLWFGSIVQEEEGQRGLSLLYIGGGLSGGLMYLLMAGIFPGLAGVSWLTGASGAVMAVMAATIILVPDRRVHLFFMGDVKLKWVAIVMIALGFLGFGGGLAGGEAAHVGGVVFGMIFGVAVRLRRRQISNKKSVPGGRKERRQTLSVIEQYRADSERLDQLLDKIRISSYESLTKGEREELETLSKKIGK